jgi:hypothetical protein
MDAGCLEPRNYFLSTISTMPGPLCGSHKGTHTEDGFITGNNPEWMQEMRDAVTDRFARRYLATMEIEGAKVSPLIYFKRSFRSSNDWNWQKTDT